MLPALPTGMQWTSGAVSQGVDDLESARLLAFDPVGVYGVHYGHRLSFREFTHELQSPVEISPHLDHFRAMDESLGQLARGRCTRPGIRTTHASPARAA